MKTPRSYLLAAPIMLVALAACGGDTDPAEPDDVAASQDSAAQESSADETTGDTANETADEMADEDSASQTDPGSDVLSRTTAIAGAVTAWQDAETLEEAQVHAEAARNLVVGPSGPYYGDATGDGTVQGANEDGFLPGLSGQGGLALTMAEDPNVERDVLGGSWEDPADRWATLDTAINEWSPTNNPFPTLPSHPQRIVGWATLTLDSENLDEAIEYAGHAQIHVDVTASAVLPM